ncbi:hypothetical protein GCM10023260_06890 [Bartonella acomydis]|uniref:Uncharacterized protein n=1 Tax=Bartonella acomydis TaxID=686234 RepID=A0ABP9ML94_9HYPH
MSGRVYGKLQQFIQNLNDMEEVEATLPLLKLHLKCKIEAEKAHKTLTGNFRRGYELTAF